MKKVLLISALGLILAGCNATVYDGGYRPRPVVDVYTSPSPVYIPAPAPRPYYVTGPQRPVFVHRPVRCYTVWDNTPRGYRERKVCG